MMSTIHENQILAAQEERSTRLDCRECDASPTRSEKQFAGRRSQQSVSFDSTTYSQEDRRHCQFLRSRQSIRNRPFCPPSLTMILLLVSVCSMLLSAATASGLRWEGGLEEPRPHRRQLQQDDDDNHVITDCGCPDTCTSTILNRLVTDQSGSFTCRDRMEYVLLQQQQQQQHQSSWSQEDACRTVAMEFPAICGDCNVDDCANGIARIMSATLEPTVAQEEEEEEEATTSDPTVSMLEETSDPSVVQAETTSDPTVVQVETNDPTIFIMEETSDPTVMQAETTNDPTVMMEDRSNLIVRQAEMTSDPTVMIAQTSDPTVIQADTTSDPTVTVVEDRSNPTIRRAETTSDPTVIMVEETTSDPTVMIAQTSEPTVVVVEETNNPTVIQAEATSDPTVMQAETTSDPTVVIAQTSDPTVVIEQTSDPTVVIEQTSDPTAVPGGDDDDDETVEDRQVDFTEEPDAAEPSDEPTVPPEEAEEEPIPAPTPFPTSPRTTSDPTSAPVALASTEAPVATPAPIAASTPAPVTPAPVTATPAPVTESTSAPAVESTPAPVTPAPILESTPAPVTPAPVTEATPAPVTPAPITTPAPVTATTSSPVAPDPTRSPTRVPITPAPTIAPVQAPTTRPPTRVPTRRPSTSPTTRAPTSRAPVTRRPTSRPTRRPTRRPTPQPAPDMTLSPTRKPSPRPTIKPNRKPTPQATLFPTPEPVPTSEPTVYPTSEPTGPVSFEYEKLTSIMKDVEMEITLSFARRDLQQDTLSTNGVMSTAQCIRLWRDKVADETEKDIYNQVPNIETLDVSLDNITQALEIETSTLSFFYNIQVDMRSPILDPDIEQYIAGPFDTLQEQTDFADFLRSTNCTVFAYATSIRVLLPTNQVTPLTGGPEDETASVGPNTGLVVGVVFAAIAVVLIGALYFVQRTRQRNSEYSKEPGTPLADSDAHDDGFRLSQIGMRMSPDGDVSTLSDPLPITTLSIPKDETSTIGSFSLDYDYQKAYQHPSVSDVQSFDEEPRMYISADDETLQKQFTSEDHFTVSAPSGTLGLVLESSEDSVPVVSGIRSDSVLFDEVRIGDRLLSVDGQDVSDLLTSEVSRLIASKKHQPIRRLVFLRPLAQMK